MGRGNVELTEGQQRRIARYLREVGEHLHDLPGDQRERALSRLNERIERELTRTGDPAGDEFLDRLLAGYGTPASQALRIADAQDPEPATFLAWNNRLWLGVCAGIARHFNLDPTVVRVLAVLLGFIPFVLPLLLWAYLGFFVYEYYTVQGRGLDRVDAFKVLRSGGALLGIAILLHAVARFFLFFIDYAHVQLMRTKLVYPADWGWLTEYTGTLFFFALALGVPLTAIAAMPVSANWSGTLRKTVQAGLAIYAVLLCLGVACAIVGVVLANAGQMPDTPGLDAILDLAR
ncbi:MAG: PspC domain-containing protein [Candidatus Hydrogenedentes bacterium]|nr:PspC domain-containing protein [Candidatus Hydrogenedentota bacterium]